MRIERTKNSQGPQYFAPDNTAFVCQHSEQLWQKLRVRRERLSDVSRAFDELAESHDGMVASACRFQRYQ